MKNMKGNILITGATGFIGKRLVAALSRSETDLFILARDKTKAQKLLNQYPAIKIILGDLQSPETYTKHLSSVKTIYHLAAKTGIWGSKNEFERINYCGTKNLLDRAEKYGVEKFIYCSTQNVTYKYGYLVPQRIQKQNTPYLKKSEYNDFYSLSKARAEKYVLAKNRQKFFTTAIRPGWAWGTGDTNLFPNIVAMTQKGLVVMVGNGRNRVATSYVDNINHAAILAGQNPEAGGRAFYVTDDHPLTTGKFIHDLLDAAGLPRPNIFLPYSIAYPLAASLELIHRLFNPRKRPILTRFDVTALARDMLLDISQTKRILGYKPVVSYAVGMKEFKKWWQETGRELYEKKNNCRLKLRKEV